MVINTDLVEISKFEVNEQNNTKKHKTPRIENNMNNDVFKESLMLITENKDYKL